MALPLVVRLVGFERCRWLVRTNYRLHVLLPIPTIVIASLCYRFSQTQNNLYSFFRIVSANGKLTIPVRSQKTIYWIIFRFPVIFQCGGIMI